MHDYLVEIECYFGRRYRFQVTAESKEMALEKAKETVYFKDDNAIKSSLRVVRKLKGGFDA